MILITGGAGLLGSELINQLLAAGEKIKAIYNRTPLSISHANLHTVPCDILDVCALEEIMQDVTQVYHCAGYVSFAPDAVEKLYKINVEGTANLVNAALEAGVSKFVHVSSVASLGRYNVSGLVHEKMQWVNGNKNSKYAFSKYLGEMEVWRAIAEGLNALIVNPSIILGAGNWNDGSTAIFKTGFNELAWYTGGNSGFVDVKDVAAVMITLMESDISAERFIVNGHNSAYRNVFNLIADGFNKKRPYKKLTPLLAALAWRLEKIKTIFTKKQPLITRETVTSAMESVSYDNSKFQKLFPSFRYRSLEETISRCCSNLQQKLNKA